MSENNMEMMNKCPGCGRHCDLSAPSCPRGEAYARGERPEESGHNHEHDLEQGWRERRGHGEVREGRSRREHGEEFGHHGGHEHPEEHDFRSGKGLHKGHHRPQNEEAYQAMDTDGKLNAILHELHHMSRFGMESRGGQGRILQILAEEGSMTQRSLTEKLGIQPGSASEVIGKLERAGFITRSENTEDRRTADVSLTEAGREQLEAKKQEKPELFSALSEEEKEQLLALLEKLRADWREIFPRERHSRDDHSVHERQHGSRKDR